MFICKVSQLMQELDYYTKADFAYCTTSQYGQSSFYNEIQNFYINPLIIKWQYMFPDAPYTLIIILLCLTPDNFTHQG
jgi:hypothetical protein